MRREVPDGLIEFEEAPSGWLTKDGKPRIKPWRAYYWTPTDGDRVRLPSTTTLLDSICPKGGIPHWSEARGIEGAVEAFDKGIVTAENEPSEVVDLVRYHKLGAEAAKNEAAERGLNVHALNEVYMLTGEAPRLKDHPEHHRGYIQGYARWLLHANPEPVAVEQLIASPRDGYAGRLDLRAKAKSVLTTVDFKTQGRAGIYRGAHLQVSLYERGEVSCGGEPAARKIVVVFAANGEFREMEVEVADWQIEAALLFYRACKPIDSACESANRIERAARTT
jgi:hypothetical protein